MADAVVLATADIHVDGGRHGGTNPLTGRRRAWESTHAIWLDMCRHAVDISADAVVVPGDIFLNGWPKAEAVEMIADGLRLLDEGGVPAIVGDGNHEWIARQKGHRSPLEHLQDIVNVRVVIEPELVKLPSGLQIAFVPWPRRAELLEPDEMDGLSPLEIDALVAARAAECIEMLGDQVDSARGPALLAAHATVGDAMVGSAKRGSEMGLAELFAEPVLALGDIDVDPWQHVALGHIHRRQQMGDRCWYVGSPDRLDFSDESVEKAYSLIRIPDNGGLATVEAIPTGARRFSTIEVPSGADTASLELLAPEDIEGAVVRIELAPGSPVNLSSEVKRLFERAGASVASVHAPPLPRLRSQRTVVAEDASPIEGLEKWATEQQVDSAQLERLKEKAALMIDSLTPIGAEGE